MRYPDNIPPEQLTVNASNDMLLFTAALSILIGAALLMGSLTAYGIISLFIIIDRRFIRPEEDMLNEQFGRTWTE
ncbi:MAG: hypothetical protein KJP15_05595 [Gammaproteobacteria bacterium]|nr:hypothetical protein [Gammaproteobacteria bacterium]